MRKMKDSGIEWIGEIPESWASPRIKFYTEIDSGEMISKEEFDENGEFPVIGSNGEIGKTYKNNNQNSVITTGRVGTVGTVQIVENAWITDNALIIKPKINIEFLKYVIPNFDFDMMLSEYEKEMGVLEQQIENDRDTINTLETETNNVEHFMELVKRYTDFTELTAPMINEFVSKIMIHKAEGKGAERTQEVEIYLNYVGKVELPQEQVILSEEELLQQEKERKRLEKKRASNRKYMARKREEIRRQQEKERTETAV